ncbi:MAG: 7-dehydrocholesterol reductase [Myxococcota bacterium]
MNDVTARARHRVIDNRFESWLTGLPVGASKPEPPERTPLDAGFVRAWLGPAALIFTTPFLVLLLWMACVHYEGSLAVMAAAGPADWLGHVPAPTLTSVGIVVGWVVFQALLLTLLPGRRFLGPVTPEGAQPEYKLNGVLAWFVTHGLLFGVAWPAGLLDPGALYHHYGAVLVTLNIGALAFCAFLYWKGRRHPSGPDNVVTGNRLFDFFQGPELHPRLGRMNLKQLINCRVSMMGWSVVFVSFAITQYQTQGFLSTSMAASVGVLVVYLFKFFWWEGGYFHSLDIMHDRFGYYICWGVLVWVPGVYCLVALWLVGHPIQWHPGVAAAMFLFGVLCIYVNYQADAQRRRVRATDGDTTVWGRKPDLIHARYTTADGEERRSLLLVSGWWGVARHFHYVPELGLAFAWTVPAGFSHFLPWFYWIFLFILLMDRAVRDEKRCARKYGPYWDEYCARVRWRVLPHVF